MSVRRVNGLPAMQTLTRRKKIARDIRAELAEYVYNVRDLATDPQDLRLGRIDDKFQDLLALEGLRRHREAGR